MTRLELHRVSLLARFSALSLLCFVAVGIVLAQVVKHQIHQRAETRAAETAVLLAADVTEAARAKGSLRNGFTGEEERSIDHLLGSPLVEDDVVAVKLWNRGGRLIYATNKAIEGRTFPKSADLRGALEGQRVVKFALEDPDERSQDRDVFEIYAPVPNGRGGLSGAVLEVYFRLGPVRAQVSRDTRSVLTAFGSGFVLLYLALFPILAGVSRTLRASYREVSQVAEELQHAALPDHLPVLPGMAMAARYRPGGGNVQVGGDWYDAVTHDDGRLGFMVGDVAGHGLEAARLMGQIRGGLHMQALAGTPPADLFVMANSYIRRIAPEKIVTSAMAVWDQVRSEVTIASAGHLPPVLVDPGRRARLLDVHVGPPLGAQSLAAYEELVFKVPAGSMLLLYTDGLVDDRSRPLRAQLNQLRATVEAGPLEPQAMCDHLLASLGAANGDQDDVAILAIQSLSSPGSALEFEIEADADAIGPARHRLGRWLDTVGAEPEESRRLLVAFGEACANAVEHPYGLGDAKALIAAREIDGHIEVEVRDFGRWRTSGPTPGRGRGLQIMEKVVDEHEIVRDSTGTTVRLRQRKHHPLTG